MAVAGMAMVIAGTVVGAQGASDKRTPVEAALLHFQETRGQCKAPSLRSVANLYQVPKSTLSRAIKNGLVCRKSGPPPVLTDIEFKALLKTVEVCYDAGFSPYKEDVSDYVLRIVTETPRPKGSNASKIADDWIKNKTVGERWLRNFNKHPAIARRREEKMERSRYEVTQDQLHTIFTRVSELIKAHPELAADSRRWWNCDETCLMPDGKNRKVYCIKGRRKRALTPGNKTRFSITMLPCVCADGSKIPPLFIAKGTSGKNGVHTPKWWSQMANILRGTGYERSTCVQQVSCELTPSVPPSQESSLLLV